MKSISLTLLFFLSISICSIAQIDKSDLMGVWVNTKTDMKDGSRLIPIYPDYFNYFQITFRENRIITDFYPSQNNSFFINNSYQLKNNLIESSAHFSYEIEKLSKDSLIIVEKMKGIKDDKLKRYYMIKKEKVFAMEKLKNDGNKHLKANHYYSPKFNGSIMRYLMNGLKKYTNLRLKGQLIIFMEEKKVDVKVLYRDSNNTNQEKIITRLLKKTFKKWNLEGFNEYSTIAIDFVIIMQKRKTYSSLTAELHTNSFTQAIGRTPFNYRQRIEQNKIFDHGNISFESGNYEDAIHFYTKLFKLNPTKVEALYNRASAYIRLRRYDKACLDFKKLKDLGQKQGENLYNENCRNK